MNHPSVPISVCIPAAMDIGGRIMLCGCPSSVSAHVCASKELNLARYLVSDRVESCVWTEFRPTSADDEGQAKDELVKSCRRMGQGQGR